MISFILPNNILEDGCSCELTCKGSHVNFHFHAFSLFSLEHLIDSLFSFEIGIDGDRFPPKYYGTRAWGGSVRLRHPEWLQRVFPKCSCRGSCKGRRWIMNWLFRHPSLRLLISSARRIPIYGWSFGWMPTSLSLHTTISFLIPSPSFQTTINTWYCKIGLCRSGFGRCQTA